MSKFEGSERARTRARLGVVSRRGTRAEREDARRAHAEAMLEEHIKRTVDSAPPLSPEQIDRIVCLLKSGESR